MGLWWAVSTYSNQDSEQSAQYKKKLIRRESFESSSFLRDTHKSNKELQINSCKSLNSRGEGKKDFHQKSEV